MLFLAPICWTCSRLQGHVLLCCSFDVFEVLEMLHLEDILVETSMCDFTMSSTISFIGPTDDSQPMGNSRNLENSTPKTSNAICFTVIYIVGTTYIMYM